jgi:hypothetical protein
MQSLLHYFARQERFTVCMYERRLLPCSGMCTYQSRFVAVGLVPR